MTAGWWRSRGVRAAIGVVAVLAGSLLPFEPAESQAPTNSETLGWGFVTPAALALKGDDLFVANYSNYSVSEVSLSTGALVRVIAGPQYKFDGVRALALWGDDLFVASSVSGGHGLLTEVNASTGALVRVIAGTQYKFNFPFDLAVKGDDLFVANNEGLGHVTEVSAPTGALVRVIAVGGPLAISGDNLFVADYLESSISEFNASTGAFVRGAGGPASKLEYPAALTVSGGDIYVAGNYKGYRTSVVAEFSASTGRLVRVMGGPQYQFDSPDAMVVSGGNLFVANSVGRSQGIRLAAGRSVTEINASTGALVKVLDGPGYKFDDPEAMLIAGGDVLVTNESGNWVTQINALTGALVKVIAGPRYGFEWPDRILLRGDDLVEADGYGGTLYTVNLSTGALVWRITGQQYDLDDAIGESLDPDAIALSGDDLFTVGLYSDAVTEVNASTGALVKVTRGYANGAPLAGTGWAWPDAIVANSSSLLLCSAPTGSGSVSDLDPSTGSVAWRAVAPNFDDPDAIAADGADFFVTAGLSNSVTEFNSSTGAVVKQMVGPQYGFAYPDALALNGDDLFVANYGGSVTEMNTLTGAVVRQISGPQYGFAYPAAITIDGNDLFVANYEGRSVTEVDAATGALVRVMAGPQYDFEGPDAIASSGAYLYVANGLGNWVTEVDISTGSVVRLIAGLR